MALEAPVPSVASSFSSGGIIADARLQRVSSRLNGIARLARACLHEGRARLTPSRPDRETNTFRLSSPKDGWWNHVPRSLLRYQQSWPRQRVLESFSGDDRNRTQRSMGEPWRTHTRVGRKASGSNPGEDGGPRWGPCGGRLQGQHGQRAVNAFTLAITHPAIFVEKLRRIF